MNIMDDNTIIDLLISYKQFNTMEAGLQLIKQYCLEKEKPPQETEFFMQLLLHPIATFNGLSIASCAEDAVNYFESKLNLKSLYVNKEGNLLFIKYLKDEQIE